MTVMKKKYRINNSCERPRIPTQDTQRYLNVIVESEVILLNVLSYCFTKKSYNKLLEKLIGMKNNTKTHETIWRQASASPCLTPRVVDIGSDR